MPIYNVYATPRADLGVAIQEFAGPMAGQYMARRVSPNLEVAKEAATYSKFKRERQMIDDGDELERDDGAAYSRTDFDVEDDSYATSERGIEVQVTAKQRKRYRRDFDADLGASKTGMRRILIRRERRSAALHFNTTTWPTGDSQLYTDVSNVWGTVASSTPIDDIRLAALKIQELTGIMPDTLILNAVNLTNLMLSTQIKGQLGTNSDATWERKLQSLAALLGLSKIISPMAPTYNSANPAQTISAAQIWSSSYVMLAKTANPGDPDDTPCVSRTFVWDEDGVDDQIESVMDETFGMVVEHYYEVQTRSDIFRFRENVQEKIVDKYFGHLLKVD